MTPTSSVKQILVNIGWTYGAQLLTIIAQVLYAAVTTRLVSADEFGAYAVALAASGFVQLMAMGGLGQAVGRMERLHVPRLASLFSYSWILGILGAVIIFFGAPAWAHLWSSPAAVDAIRLASISALVAPAFGLVSGLVRRLGKYRQFAATTVLSNFLGMLVGLLAVVLLNDSVGLMVSVILGQCLGLISCLVLCERMIGKLGSLGGARADITYSWNLTGTNLVSYLIANATKISVTRFAGAAVLGQWNRAEVLTTVPFQQIQNSIVQVIYPEFRHVKDSPAAARSVWTDLLVLCAFLVLPFASICSAVLPLVLPMLFGGGWTTASRLTMVLAYVGALQLLSSVLGGAIESLGRFRWMWSNGAVIAALQVVAVTVIALGGGLESAMVFLIITSILRHLIQVVQCVRGGYLAAIPIVFGYSIAIFAAAMVWVLFYVLLRPSLMLSAPTWALVSAGLWLFGVALLTIYSWRSMPVAVILRRYRNRK